eukprot:CAMPEP_0170256932 /NCGR_PEP_ID=MMETSP0116_2-20130129/28321_1 /TAXON_ID=400756 /ORGANISM="Durinskia baltica, Strain CSIRO CS-38" /LENGTH=120 /DNA_ID=CAMNT_0010507945 /DNA_START=74 /DNA_END=432 /DNA_ORIENTATION=-
MEAYSPTAYSQGLEASGAGGPAAWQHRGFSGRGANPPSPGGGQVGDAAAGSGMYYVMVPLPFGGAGGPVGYGPPYPMGYTSQEAFPGCWGAPTSERAAEAANVAGASQAGGSSAAAGASA